MMLLGFAGLGFGGQEPSIPVLGRAPRAYQWTCRCSALLPWQILTEGGRISYSSHPLAARAEAVYSGGNNGLAPSAAAELVGLAMVLELGLVQIHLLGTRRAVVVAEQIKQQAVAVLDHVDRCDGGLRAPPFP